MFTILYLKFYRFENISVWSKIFDNLKKKIEEKSDLNYQQLREKSRKIVCNSSVKLVLILIFYNSNNFLSFMFQVS